MKDCGADVNSKAGGRRGRRRAFRYIKHIDSMVLILDDASTFLALIDWVSMFVPWCRCLFLWCLWTILRVFFLVDEAITSVDPVPKCPTSLKLSWQNSYTNLAPTPIRIFGTHHALRAWIDGGMDI